jgi:hypothetical protein
LLELQLQFNKLGARAERHPSDYSTVSQKKKDWDSISAVSRSSSQMNSVKQNRMAENVLDHPKVLANA